MSPSRRARVGNDSESVEKTLLEVPVGLAAPAGASFFIFCDSRSIKIF